MPKAEAWTIFALLALVFWGLWGFFPKISTRYLDPKSALIYAEIGAVLIILLLLSYMRFDLGYHPTGVVFAGLTGIAASIGGLFFLYAVSRGSAPVVVAITALYPVITIGLAFTFLREPITWKQGVGIGLALVAMALMIV